MKVTKTINAAQAGVELRFSEKPSDSVLELLKEQDWRFNKDGWKDPRWYKKRSPAAEKFADNLVRVLHDEDKTVSEPVADPTPAPAAPRAVERVTIAIPATGGGKKSFF